MEYAPGKHYTVEPGGRIFALGKDEAVVGAYAAKKLGWKAGTTFKPYHGLAFDPKAQHDELYTVVGVLAPTNTPVDRVIWIPLEGVQTMKGHNPLAATELSAVLLQLKAPTAGLMLNTLLNGPGGQADLRLPDRRDRGRTLQQDRLARPGC